MIETDVRFISASKVRKSKVYLAGNVLVHQT